jgi:aspartate aminotransferase
MLELLNKPKGDPIISLMTEFQEDTREEKIDLGIGIYRDENGQTPVMHAVRNAAVTIAATEQSKSYIGLVGDEQFNIAIQSLVLKGTEAISRASTLQTSGASGALRMLADLIKMARPNSRVWISNPSYINHRPIMEKAGLLVSEYPYLDEETKLVNEESMLKVVETLGVQDVLLIHGCCHNPSGADLSIEAWKRISHLAKKNGFLPFIDVAYQGLGEGMDEDVAGLRLLVDEVDEVLISTSCSKNFGLYKERTGATIVIGKTLQKAKDARIIIGELARGSYSMPPAHGAAIVAQVLNDTILTNLRQLLVFLVVFLVFFYLF